MALMRTSNPALTAKTFADLRRDPTAPAMTLEGTVNKAAFLLFLVAVPAAWVWSQVRTAFDPAVAGPWIALGVIGGVIGNGRAAGRGRGEISVGAGSFK